MGRGRAVRPAPLVCDPMFFDLPLADPRHPFHVQHMEMALEEAGLPRTRTRCRSGPSSSHPERGVIAPGPQPARATPRPDRPRRDDRHHPGRPGPRAPGGWTSASCTSRWSRARCAPGRSSRPALPLRRLRLHRPEGRGVRHALPHPHRPAAQPPRPGDRRGAGRPVCGRPDRLLRGQARAWGRSEVEPADPRDPPRAAESGCPPAALGPDGARHHPRGGVGDRDAGRRRGGPGRGPAAARRPRGQHDPVAEREAAGPAGQQGRRGPHRLRADRRRPEPDPRDDPDHFVGRAGPRVPAGGAPPGPQAGRSAARR